MASGPQSIGAADANGVGMLATVYVDQTSGRGSIGVGTSVGLGSLGRARCRAVGRFFLATVWVERCWDIGLAIAWRKHRGSVGLGLLWLEKAWVSRSEPRQMASTKNKLLAYEEERHGRR